MTPEEAQAFRAQVLAKIEAAPVPSAEAILAGRERIAANREARRNGAPRRTGYDQRGSFYSRARRTAKLLLQFGDGVTCPCAYCLTPLTAATLTQDKIYTVWEGGGYTFDNVLPACLSCNSRRRDRLILEFIEEAQAAIELAEGQLSTKEE
jgi:hypothetical protein